MKRADVEIGQDYAVGLHGSGQYDRERAVIARVVSETKAMKSVYDPYAFRGRTAEYTGFVVELLEDSGEVKAGTTRTVEARQIFRSAEEERQARRAREARDRERDARNAHLERLADTLGGRRHGDYILLSAEAAGKLTERIR